MGRALRYVVSVRGRSVGVSVTPLGDGRLSVAIEGSSEPPLEVTLLGDTPDAAIAVGSQVLEVRASGADVTVGRERRPVRVESRERASKSSGTSQGGASGTVRSPMPGRVVKVLVAPGASVERGAGVVVVEAMKMENELSAPISGVVERVLVSAGDRVERGAALVEIR
jgi:biotin carboxyl carrier protein